tara:strand:+ start:103 stop:297 length:195 start_codon:yes stop_codon:yes gene_type:complete
MDLKSDKRRTKKDKERRNREINGKYSAKHIRIQEQCQENHLKNVQQEREDLSNRGKPKKDKKQK